MYTVDCVKDDGTGVFEPAALSGKFVKVVATTASSLQIAKIWVHEINDEICSGNQCDGYRGRQAATRSGKPCIKWDKA